MLSDGIEAINREVHRMVFDVDYFTSVAVKKEQFLLVDWLEKAHHLINRDSREFLSSI